MVCAIARSGQRGRRRHAGDLGAPERTEPERVTTTVHAGRGTAGGWAAAVAIAIALSACGGNSTTDDDALALKGEPSTPCTRAIADGHNHEGAGEPTPVAFLPSVRECRTLDEWTAAAKAFGINLRGREAQFVDNTCNATTTSAEVKASKTCQEARAALADPRSVP